MKEAYRNFESDLKISGGKYSCGKQFGGMLPLWHIASLLSASQQTTESHSPLAPPNKWANPKDSWSAVDAIGLANAPQSQDRNSANQCVRHVPSEE